MHTPWAFGKSWNYLKTLETLEFREIIIEIKLEIHQWSVVKGYTVVTHTESI